MHTRTTSDYTPTLKGSRDENAAFNARREMMNVFAASSVPRRRSRHPGLKGALRKLSNV